MLLFRKMAREPQLVWVAACVLLLAACAHAQRDSYEVRDAEEDEESGEGGGSGADARVDYTRYFGAAGGSPAASGAAPRHDSDAGFVQPIDFGALLANARLGEGGEAVAASSSRVQDFFRAADASNAALFALPSSSDVFASDAAGSETQNNGTGFTSPAVRFPSLFDAGRAEEGFRPQDFLQGGSSETKEAVPQPSGIFSPSFSKLDADYRPQSQASHPKSSYTSDSQSRPQSAAPTHRPYLPPSSSAPSSNPSSIHSSSKSIPSQYQPQHASPTHQTTRPAVPIDIYGSKASYPVSSEPHVGKSSYPLPQPLIDYTAQIKAVQTAPSKINPDYYSLPPSQPSSYLPSTAAPLPKLDYNVQPTGESYSATNSQAQTQGAQAPKDKKCKKIDKTITTDDLVQGRFRRNAAMTCYVCEDPKTGGNYEECSYATEPKAAKYFIGHAQSYSSDKPLETKSYRYRRDVSPFRFGAYSHHEPSFSADSSYKYPYASSKNSDNYHFSEEDFAPSHADYSSAPSDKNCNKVQKESMTCFVCKDPKTGGSYEQCSYAVEPKANNYFVARESSFNTGNKSPYRERYRRDDKYGSSSKIDRDSSDFPSSSRSARDESRPGVGLDPFLYGEPKLYNPKEDKESSASENQDSFYAPYRSYEDYFSHLFPELVPREASASNIEGVSDEKTIPGFEYKTSIPDYFTDTEKKKDLDAVLGEFAAKDRSHCKKVFKDKMTCYQCVDKQGMQHEECMFVAASEPKSQHLAYKEVKEFSLVPKAAAAAAAESSKVAVTAAASAAATTPAEPVNPLAGLKLSPEVAAAAAAALAAVDAKQKRDAALVDEMLASASEPHAQRRRQADSPPPKRAPAEPTPPELSELDRTPDGLYSAETRHRFDPVLKVTLPEYMLTRSEHEEIFDEVMASGR